MHTKKALGGSRQKTNEDTVRLQRQQKHNRCHIHHQKTTIICRKKGKQRPNDPTRLGKAFDKASHEWLFRSLEAMGIPTELTELMQELYRYPEFCVETDKVKWKHFQRKCPVRN